MKRSHCVLLVTVLSWTPWVAADTLLVAVASNFTSTLEAVAESFSAETGHVVRITGASTGVHYAQIINGAPFDALFAADAERTAALEAGGFTVPGTRFTYAVGRLALWSASRQAVDGQGEVLRAANFTRLAVANPDTAPYGSAALEVLSALGILETVRSRLITGTNIGQTHQFVASGAVPLGLVAYSQVLAANHGSYWLVPETLHTPIVQEAVLLRDSPAGRALLAYLRGPEARARIEADGYRVP